MAPTKRVFILGAGFSKPAGMPLATGLLPLLSNKLQHAEMREWLDGLSERLAWLPGNEGQTKSFALNIEQVFHFAHFDIEAHRLMQQLARVGRKDGPGTPWNAAEAVGHWLSVLEDALRDVMMDQEDRADLAPISRWANHVHLRDAVLTFNYDTLVERALSEAGKGWNHATSQVGEGEIPVCKLHGSIDWLVADRSQKLEKLDLLFDKENANRSHQKTGEIEDDFRLWRCRTREQLRRWISGRDLQSGPWKTVGMAGLGTYKQLHEIPGLGPVWANGMRALYEAESAVVVGFAMSDFDAMAQMQFAEVARKRQGEDHPLRVRVIDPFVNEESRSRFKRVFRCVEFEQRFHEDVEWESY